jgi:glycerophosphoryl diester phosphodiesterase
MICHDPVIRGMDIATTAAAVLGLSTLDEVIASFGSRAFLDIELKVGGLEQTVLALLREQPPQSGYVVSSFLPQVLSEIHSLDATVPLGFIFDNSSATEVWQRLPVDWVMPHVALADQSFVGRTHGAGKKVMVWTVNDADEIKKLAAWGADAIISDDTQLARRGAG